MSGKVGSTRDIASEPAASAVERRLNSWKEIAVFLGRTERTAKRWESTHGLPVRRVPSSGRGSVFAYEHELVAWLNGVKPNEAVTPAALKRAPTDYRFIGLMAGAVLVMLLATAVFFMRREDKPSEGLGTRDQIAADLYRSGQHEWQTRTPTGLTRAIASFNAAIARDGHFAKAYLGLADAYLLAREFGMMPAKAAYSQARTATAHALKLDPQLSGAHAALAFVDFYDAHQVVEARREFKTATSLDPKDSIARHWYATFLMTIGEFNSAREQIEAAENLDSESTAIVADKALIMFYQGQRKDAARMLRQIESDQPAFASAHSYLAYINLIDGDDSGYLRELTEFANARDDASTRALAAAGEDALRHGGHSEMLRTILVVRQTGFSNGDGSAYAVGQTYALLGDSARALQFLQTSIARSEPEAIGLKVDFLLTALHARPEFQRLLSETGLQT